MDGWMEDVEAYGSPGWNIRPPTPAMGSTAGGGLIAPFHWAKMVAFFSIYKGDACGMCSSMGPTQLTQAPFQMFSHASHMPLQALPSSATLLTDLGLTSSQLLNVTPGTPPDA